MVRKIAMSGSLKWDDRLKIKEVIFILKQKFNSKLDIIGGGLRNGADSIIKKFCLEFNVEFAELPPCDYKWNPYCVEPAYMYSKSYHSKNIYVRNEKLSKECDILILFRTVDDTAPFIDDLINKFNKKNKKILVIN